MCKNVEYYQFCCNRFSLSAVSDALKAPRQRGIDTLIRLDMMLDRDSYMQIGRILDFCREVERSARVNGGHSNRLTYSEIARAILKDALLSGRENLDLYLPHYFRV